MASRPRALLPKSRAAPDRTAAILASVDSVTGIINPNKTEAAGNGHSPQKPDTLSSSMKLHRFSPQIAEMVGIEAAIIYEYLLYRMRQNPKGFVSASWRELTDQYCYLTIGEVRGAVDRLCRGEDRGRPALLVRKRVGRGYRYWSADEELPSSCSKPHTFYDKHAALVGIEGAVVLNNFRYWINLRREDAAEQRAEGRKRISGNSVTEAIDKLNRDAYSKSKGDAYLITTIEKWQQQHPYVSLTTAKRTFAELVRQGYLRRQPCGSCGTRWSFGALYFKATSQKPLILNGFVQNESQINGVECQNSATEAKLSQSGVKLTYSNPNPSTPACSKQKAIETKLTKAKFASQAQQEKQIKEVIAQSPDGDVSGRCNPPSVEFRTARVQKLNVQQAGDNRQQTKTITSHPVKSSGSMQGAKALAASSDFDSRRLKNSSLLEGPAGTKAKDTTATLNVESVAMRKNAGAEPTTAGAGTRSPASITSHRSCPPDDAVLVEYYRRTTGKKLDPDDFEEWSRMLDHWKAQWANKKKVAE